MNNKVALFGGTFDPMHLGHLNLALTAARECNLDKLIFIPNYISPFKQDIRVTPGSMRCDMVRSILHYDDSFCVSHYEIDREEPSYTFDTLAYFRDVCGVNPAFIIGWDSLLTIDTWHRGEDIIAEYPLITGLRPDYDAEAGLEKIREYEARYNADITVLHIEPFRASSSQIRADIADGIDVSELLPPEIEEYIRVNGLYRL